MLINGLTLFGRILFSVSIDSILIFLTSNSSSELMDEILKMFLGKITVIYSLILTNQPQLTNYLALSLSLISTKSSQSTTKHPAKSPQSNHKVAQSSLWPPTNLKKWAPPKLSQKNVFPLLCQVLHHSGIHICLPYILHFGLGTLNTQFSPQIHPLLSVFNFL